MDERLGFGAQPAWSWGDSIPAASSTGASFSPDATSGPDFEGETRSRARTADARKAAAAEPEAAAQEPQPQQRRRHYRSRTCRICLEAVPPTFEVNTGSTSTIFGARPRVRYVSEDPELGRLISPCKCKGSQRYVHEGCLQAWRRAAPMNDRNFWSCPTCKFQYRMDRLRWANWVSSKLTRAVLTILVFLVAIFVLGFVADPIINLWVDPVGLIVGTVSDISDDVDAAMEDLGDDFGPATWYIHFVKGILALGLVGCVKTFLAMSPWQWWHIRAGGMLGGNRRGRDRVESINVFLVIIGLFTFLTAVWKGISLLSGRVLEKVSDRVLDIPGDDDDDDDDDDDTKDENEETDGT